MANKEGFDGRKRWGNSAQKGYGVNSPAMMEARSAAIKAKKGGKRTSTHNHHGNKWGSPEAISDFKKEFGGPKKYK